MSPASLRRVDGGDHPLSAVRVHAAQRRVVRQRRGFGEGHGPRLRAASTSPIAETWLAMLDAELREQLPRQAAGRDARRRLAGAGALEHVADVVVAVLDGAG